MRMAAFPFSRFGGTCPRWNIHASFKTPGRTVTQIVETPDGARYFTFARTVQRIGQEVYGQAGAASNGATGSAPESEPGTVEGEYREV